MQMAFCSFKKSFMVHNKVKCTAPTQKHGLHGSQLFNRRFVGGQNSIVQGGAKMHPADPKNAMQKMQKMQERRVVAGMAASHSVHPLMGNTVFAKRNKTPLGGHY